MGTGLESNTAFHTVEAIAQVPYLLYKTPDTFTLIDVSRATQSVVVWRHRARIPRRFSAIEPLLVSLRVVKIGKVGAARSLLLSGRSFQEFMIAKLMDESEFLLATSKSAGSVPRTSGTAS
jgi:aminoglycoside N3'-acetyltransferase